jgi:hypothetical protein
MALGEGFIMQKVDMKEKKTNGVRVASKGRSHKSARKAKPAPHKPAKTELAQFASKRLVAHSNYWDAITNCSDPVAYLNINASFLQNAMNNYHDAWLDILGIAAAEVNEIADVAMHTASVKLALADRTDAEIGENVCV